MDIKNISLNDIKVGRDSVTLGDYYGVQELERYINSILEAPKTRGKQEMNAGIIAATIYKLGVMQGKREVRNKNKVLPEIIKIDNELIHISYTSLQKNRLSELCIRGNDELVLFISNKLSDSKKFEEIQLYIDNSNKIEYFDREINRVKER